MDPTSAEPVAPANRSTSGNVEEERRQFCDKIRNRLTFVLWGYKCSEHEKKYPDGKWKNGLSESELLHDEVTKYLLEHLRNCKLGRCCWPVCYFTREETFHLMKCTNNNCVRCKPLKDLEIPKDLLRTDAPAPPEFRNHIPQFVKESFFEAILRETHPGMNPNLDEVKKMKNLVMAFEKKILENATCRFTYMKNLAGIFKHLKNEEDREEVFLLAELAAEDDGTSNELERILEQVRMEEEQEINFI